MSDRSDTLPRIIAAKKRLAAVPCPPPKEKVIRRDTTTDTTVAAIGLPRHPPPKAITESTRDVSDTLRTHGGRAVELSHVLAARGYAASTLGDGGSRGTDGTSSTERAATKDFHDRWKNADRALAQALAEFDRWAKHANHLILDLIHHAQDLDPIPAGTGECQACGRFCRPDATRPGNRLRSGFCPTDYRAMLRSSTTDRGGWIRARRGDLTDDQGILHTPEPDHDIDLTTEKLA